jgi:uncharacterized protein (DUF427 family)
MPHYGFSKVDGSAGNAAVLGWVVEGLTVKCALGAEFMSEKLVRIPGADHPITVGKNPDRVVVQVGDQVIANTREALSLQEASYPAVQYIPRKDVDLTLLERTHHHSYCPYKGVASYYSVIPAGKEGVNAVWTYEEPYDAVVDIREYVAFYPDKVSIEIITD